MARLHDVPPLIHGFHVLPLTFPALPSLPTTATHYLYIAGHDPKIPTETTPRSLFIVNVPIDATEAHIRHLLSLQLGLPQGRIEEVSFEKQRNQQNVGGSGPEGGDGGPQSRKRKRSISQRPVRVLEESRLPSTWDRELQINGGSAIITFVDKASMDAALKAVARAIKASTQIIWGEGLNVDLPQLGSARYFNHAKLQYPDKTALLQSVNAYMTAYAAQEATQAKLQARQRSQPDADGFVTVTKGGRVDPVRQEAAQATAAKHKAKQIGLEDFYRFQTREKKKARAGELIRQFEEDKEKIRRMKEKRGSFRPE